MKDLEFIRALKGRYSTAQIADLAGVSMRAVQMWLSGNRTPSAPTIELLRIKTATPHKELA